MLIAQMPLVAHVPVGREQRLLHRALAGGEDQALVVGELPHRHQRRDLLGRLDGDAVDHRLAPRRAARLRDLVDLEPVELAGVGEEEQVVVGAGDEEVLDPVVLLQVGPVEPPAAAPLLLVGAHRDPLDVAGVGDGDDHVLFGDQVLDGELALVGHDLGPAVVAELLDHLGHLGLEDGHPLRLGGQDRLEVLDRGAHLFQLGLQLVDLEPGELGQPHVEDGIALLLAQPEPLAELRVGLGRVVRAPDDLDDLVDVVDGDLEAFEDVLPRLRRLEVELGPPDDDLVPVLDVPLQQLLQVHHLGRALVEGEHDDAEGGLHRGVLVELVQHHVGDGIALQVDDDPHAVLVGLVVHPADALDPLLHRQLGDGLHQVLLVDLVGDLGHHDLGAAGGLLLLDLGPGPHDHAAAPGLVGLLDPFPAVDEGAGGEVGPLDDLAQVGDGRIGAVDQHLDRLGHLAQVVRRDVGGHADRDAAGAVDEEVGDLGGEDRRLAKPVVEVGLEIDRVLVDVLQHRERDPGEPRLGVPVGRGRIAVHRAEVALPVDQRIAERELLDHPDQRVIDRAVAVRVVLAQHVAHHRRRLLVRPPRHQPQLVHRVQDPAVHRLQPVSHVRQGPGDDDAHRVVDERLLHLLFDEAGQDPFARVGCGHSRRVLREGQGVVVLRTTFGI